MCPPPPHTHTHWNLTKAPRGRQGNAKKIIVRNKVFECLTLLKIEVIENLGSPSNERGCVIPLSYSHPARGSDQAFSLRSPTPPPPPPPVNNPSGSSPEQGIPEPIFYGGLVYKFNLILVINSKRLSRVIKNLNKTWISCDSLHAWL